MSTESWLNGWCRNADMILIGTSSCCVGCGRELGTATIAIEDGYEFLEKLPDFPFNPKDCPLCDLRDKVQLFPPEPVDKLTQRLLLLRKKV